MSYFIIGLLLFFGVHSTGFVAPQWRERAILRVGDGAWRGLYSLASLAGLLLFIHGFALARLHPIVWYVPAPWMHTLARVLMLPVFPLLLESGFPGRIKSAAKHPMLAAVKLWATAHLLANGTAADVLLFGGFLAWAVVDRLSYRRRTQRVLPGAPPSKWNDLVVVVAGLVLYALTVGWAHERLFGVSPLS